MSFRGKGMENEEVKEIIRLAIIDGAKWADSHPYEPKIEGLEEAVEKYVAEWYKEKGYNPIDYPIDVQVSKYDFKAGAKWMAEQGETLNGKVIKKTYGDKENGDYDEWLSVHIDTILEVLPKDTKLKEGDKVIVQIRKV